MKRIPIAGEELRRFRERHHIRWDTVTVALPDLLARIRVRRPTLGGEQ
jgi:hypothetical protein